MAVDLNKTIEIFYGITQDDARMADGGNAVWDMHFDICMVHELEYLRFIRVVLGLVRPKTYYIDPAMILACCDEDRVERTCDADHEKIFRIIAQGGYRCKTKREYIRAMELVLNARPPEDIEKIALEAVYARQAAYEKDHKPHNAKCCCRKHLIEIFPGLYNEIADNAASFMLCVELILGEHKNLAKYALDYHKFGEEKAYFNIAYLDLPYHYARIIPYDKDPRRTRNYKYNAKGASFDAAAIVMPENDWGNAVSCELDETWDMLPFDTMGMKTYTEDDAKTFLSRMALNTLSDKDNCELVKGFMPIHSLDKRELHEKWFSYFFRKNKKLSEIYSRSKEKLKEFYFIKQEEIRSQINNEVYMDAQGYLAVPGRDLRSLFLTFLPAPEDEDRTIMPDDMLKAFDKQFDKEVVYILTSDARDIVWKSRSYRLPEKELIQWTIQYFNTDC